MYGLKILRFSTKYLTGLVLLFSLVNCANSASSNKQTIEKAQQLLGKQEFTKALNLAMPLAQKGDAAAQAVVGSLYFYTDKNSHHDPKKGLYWLRKSANNGNAVGQFRLGMNLVDLKSTMNPGPKKEKLKKEAIKWFTASSEQGHAFAQMELGKIYMMGLLGVKRDRIKAIKWFKLASNRFNHVSGARNTIAASSKGFADGFINNMVENKLVTQAQYKQALSEAEQWEKSHQHVYKTWPFE